RQPMAEDLDVSLVGADRTEQHQKRGCLARTIWSEQRDAFTDVDDDVDAVDGLNVLVLLAQAARFEDRPHATQAGRPARRQRSKYRRRKIAVVARVVARSLACMRADRSGTSETAQPKHSPVSIPVHHHWRAAGTYRTRDYCVGVLAVACRTNGRSSETRCN